METLTPNLQIIKQAQVLLPDADYVCDLIDLRFMWASQRALELTGYSEDDATHLKNLEVLDDSYTEQGYRKDVVERIAQSEGETDYLVKHKSGGKLKVHVQYQVFEFEKGWYQVGKVLNFEFLQESEE